MGKKPAKPVTATSYDVDMIRSAAARRWPEILSQLTTVDAAALDGSHGPCPKCGGSDRFRMIDAEAGALLCNQCFNSKNGDGFAAIQWLLDCKFNDALAKVADYLGIEPTPSADGKHRRRKSKNADPAEHLAFQPWNDGLALTWCVLRKPGITPASMIAAGCKLARYRDQYTVFALPVYGPKLSAAPPVGWTLYNVTGGLLPKFIKGKPVEWVKVKLTYGSQPGVMGSVDRLSAATTIWKLEGPSDMLACNSLADLPPDTVAITNANGAGERAPGWVLELFRDKAALVLHDADDPGERGAAGWTDEKGDRRPGWVESIAMTAADCRHVHLPFAIVPDHGQDLRDWLNQPHTYAELLALVAAADVAAKPNQPPTASAIESDDDPHRLARVNLDRYATHAAGATLRYWRDEWYTWKPSRGCYRKIGVEELRAKISQSVKSEFDRINCEQQQETWRDEPPKVQKVTKALVTNVLDATKSLTIVPSSVELMSWLDGRGRTRKNYIGMANGILDIDRLLADDSAELRDVLLPQSPSWFSTVRLPYNFDPEAKCPKWEKFLERSLEMDPERIKILQEWAGYLLLPESSQQRMLALEGDGSNGKSVYCAGITAMMGLENCSYVSVEQLCDKFVRTQTLGRLVNICPDVGEIDKANEGDLKSFVSGDVMFFDRKHLTGLNCTPTARLMMSFNNRPRFADRSGGIWRRMMIVPFNVEIPAAERVANMDKHTWWEAAGELPGIFLWAVAGLHRLRQQGRFTRSALSEAALEDYRTENNPARAFLTECLESHEHSKLKSTSIYRFYKLWAEEHGYRPLGERTFGKEIRRVFAHTERRFLGTRGDRYWCYVGVRFSQDVICGEQTSRELLF